MNATISARAGVALLWVLAVGCGASAVPAVAATSAPAPPPSAAQGTGAETPSAAPAPQAAPEAAAPEPVASGPASLAVHATVGGKRVAAHVRATTPSGELAAEGDGEAPLTLASGAYKISVQVTDASALLDKPTQTREITLPPGNHSEVELSFAWAKVQLVVKVNGQPQTGAVVTLLRKGTVVCEIHPGSEFVPVSPGRYEAQVQVKGTSIKIANILFPEGATQTVPVEVQL